MRQAVPSPRRHAVDPRLALLALVVAVQAAGALGALTTDALFYRELARPAWSPPGWLFGPVWVTLYTMIAVSIWLIWRSPTGPARRRALRWHLAQLALNAAWTPLFFGLHAVGVALIEIVILLGAIAMTIQAARHVARAAALLLVPYALWVGFATVLNASLWWLN